MKVCVFLGARDGRSLQYQQVAHELGRLLVLKGIELVYGGSGVGLMNVLADAVLSAGGKAHGVTTKQLFEVEPPHDHLTSLRIEENIQARKHVMENLADAYLVLPGGIGTMDEFFEAWTNVHIGVSHRPIGLLNFAGYYDNLLTFIDAMLAEQFVTTAQRERLIIGDAIEPLLDKVMSAVAFSRAQ